MPHIICVFGASYKGIEPCFASEGRRLGEFIAKNGFALAFGGGAVGMMGALAQGAHAYNGEIIGAVPTEFNTAEILSPYCTTVLVSESMAARKQQLISISDAFIVTPGGLGTLDELFDILVLRQLNMLSKPICIMNLQGHFDALVSMLEGYSSNPMFPSDLREYFKVCSSAEEAFEYCANALNA